MKEGEVRMRNRMLILLSRDYKEPPGVCVSARAYWAVVWRKGAVTKTSIEGLLHILRGRSTADSQYLSNSEPGGRKNCNVVTRRSALEHNTEPVGTFRFYFIDY